MTGVPSSNGTMAKSASFLTGGVVGAIDGEADSTLMALVVAALSLNLLVEEAGVLVVLFLGPVVVLIVNVLVSQSAFFLIAADGDVTLAVAATGALLVLPIFSFAGLRPYNGNGGVSIFFRTGDGAKEAFTRYPLGELILRPATPTFLLMVALAVVFGPLAYETLLFRMLSSSSSKPLLCNESSFVKQDDHEDPKDSYVATLMEGDDGTSPDRPLVALGNVKTLPPGDAAAAAACVTIIIFLILND